MRKKLCVLRKGCRLWQIINASLMNDFNVEKRDSADMEEIKELIKNPPESCVLIFIYPIWTLM